MGGKEEKSSVSFINSLLLLLEDADAVYQTTEPRTPNKSRTKAQSSFSCFTPPPGPAANNVIYLWRARTERMVRPRIEFVELTGISISTSLYSGNFSIGSLHLLAHSSIYYYPNHWLLVLVQLLLPCVCVLFACLFVDGYTPLTTVVHFFLAFVLHRLLLRILIFLWLLSVHRRAYSDPGLGQ